MGLVPARRADAPLCRPRHPAACRPIASPAWASATCRRIGASSPTSPSTRTSRSAPRPARGAGRAPWTPERLFSIFPNLAEMRGRRASQMSGGEQQMLTIARTLMGNPEAVLLDEPSEGLAPVIVEQMAAAVAPHEGRGHRRAAVGAEPQLSPRPSPTAPTSSRRAPSATRAPWPTSPPMPPCARRTSASSRRPRRGALFFP